MQCDEQNFYDSRRSCSETGISYGSWQSEHQLFPPKSMLQRNVREREENLYEHLQR